MINNYLTVAWRSLLRKKVFSAINILGLSIGMAACFLIAHYVRFELSYDRYHENVDRIYRVLIRIDAPDFSQLSAANHPGTAPTMKADFPEVEEATRLVHQSIFSGQQATWSYIDTLGNEKSFNERNVYCADPNIFKVFSIPLIHGDPETALIDVSAVAISESTSKKYFGETNPLGKILVVDGKKNLKVTGVFRDLPENSHIKFDILFSYFFKAPYDGQWNSLWDWSWPEYYTYVLLAPGTDIPNLETKLAALADKYLSKLTIGGDRKQSFVLQPITDIHLKSLNFTKEREVHSSERTVYILSLVAALILIIAWINYVNLSTAKSVERAREAGLRKVVGASKQQLIVQFLSESAMTNLIAIALAFVFVAIALPNFNQLTGKNIGGLLADTGLFREPNFWFALSAMFVVGTLFTGLYPAFAVSSFRVADVLKGKFAASQSGILLRKTLVISQFAISAALIAGTIVVMLQVDFMRKQDLGFAKDRLLILDAPRVVDSTYDSRYQTFKSEITRNNEVKGVALSSEIPGGFGTQLNHIRLLGEGPENRIEAVHYHIDPNFFPTYGIELLAGRNFRENETVWGPATEIKPLILNEATLKRIGLTKDDAVGRRVTFGLLIFEWTGEIIGVAENHHQQSLHDDYAPVIFFPNRFWGQHYTINMAMTSPAETISFIEKQYSEMFPGNPFNYYFLDDHFDRQYAADQQFGKIFGIFSAFALMVTGLGILGLSIFIIGQRIKEIAIRKVLGATTSGMIALFSKDFVWMIFFANLVALPAAYLMADQWLNRFAYRVDIGWGTFVVPVIALLTVSLLTVGLQTIKTSSENPVKSLRSE